jgi:hypothetical protein
MYTLSYTSAISKPLKYVKLPFLPTGKHGAFPKIGDSMLLINNDY